MEHVDILENKVELGAYVVYPSHNNLYIGRVIKIMPKMIRVTRINKRNNESILYANQSCVIEGPDVMAYVLKNV